MSFVRFPIVHTFSRGHPQGDNQCDFDGNKSTFVYSSNTKLIPEIPLKEHVLSKCCLCKAQKIHYCQESVQ